MADGSGGGGSAGECGGELTGGICGAAVNAKVSQATEEWYCRTHVDKLQEVTVHKYRRQ